MTNKKRNIIGISILGIAALLVIAYFGFFKEEKTQIVIEENIVEDIEKVETTSESVAVNDEQIFPDVQEEVPVDEKRIDPIPEEEVVVPEKEDSFKIINKLVDFGFQRSADRKIDTIVIHSSYNSLGGDVYDVGAIIDIYEQYGVAAHYLIGRDGKIYRLVEDKNIAYHAGVSQVPDGRKNVNDFSIGIELVNTKTDKMTDKQYDALSKLVDQIKKENKIKYVLGHDQIAPGRKDDPWNFDWNKL